MIYSVWDFGYLLHPAVSRRKVCQGFVLFGRRDAIYVFHWNWVVYLLGFDVDQSAEKC